MATRNGRQHRSGRRCPELPFPTGSVEHFEALLGSGHNVIVSEPGDDWEAGAEPQFETVIATEDDFEDDCPICEMMRARVRAGEQIEITKVSWGLSAS